MDAGISCPVYSFQEPLLLSNYPRLPINHPIFILQNRVKIIGIYTTFKSKYSSNFDMNLPTVSSFEYTIMVFINRYSIKDSTSIRVVDINLRNLRPSDDVENRFSIIYCGRPRSFFTADVPAISFSVLISRERNYDKNYLISENTRLFFLWS